MHFALNLPLNCLINGLYSISSEGIVLRYLNNTQPYVMPLCSATYTMKIVLGKLGVNMFNGPSSRRGNLYYKEE